MLTLKSYSSQTNQGPILQVNEDDISIDLVNKLYMVLDGFGGSSVGDRAVSSVIENVKKFYHKVGGDPDSTLPFSYSHKYLIEGNALINSMIYAHKSLVNENQSRKMSDRGGASGIFIAEADNLLVIASSGNCKGLVFTSGEIKDLIVPDNLENLSKDSFNRHFQTIPMSGFGLFDDLHFSIKEYRPKTGDQLVILTDGVYGRISNTEINHLFSNNKYSTNEKIEQLFELSNDRGNLDNQSALVLEY